MELSADCEPEFEGIGGPPRGPADPGPLRSRSGGMFAVESERRWILAASGVARDHPPGSPDELRAFLHGLGVGELSELVGASTMLTPPRPWRSTANRFRRYHELPTLPESFVLLGDAVANLNPVYGQGMSLAAWGARDLGAELDTQLELHPNGRLTGLSRRFQGRLAESLRVPWQLSTRADASLPATETDFELGQVLDVEFLRRLEALAMVSTRRLS